MDELSCLEFLRSSPAEFALAFTDQQFIFRLYRFDVFKLIYKKPKVRTKGYLLASDNGVEKLVVLCEFLAPSIISNIRIFRGFDMEKEMGFLIYKAFEQSFLLEKFTLLKPKRFEFE